MGEFSVGILERFGRVKSFSFPQEGGGSPFTAEPSGSTSVTTSGLAPPTDSECPVPVKEGRARWAAGGERCFWKPFLLMFEPNALWLCSAMTCVPGRPLMSPLSRRRPFPPGPVLPQPWWAKPSPRKWLCSGVSTRVGVKYCSDFNHPNQKSSEEKKSKN